MKQTNFRTRVPRVAVRLAMAGATMRGLLRGIAKFIQAGNPWAVQLIQGWSDEYKLLPPEKGSYDGLILNVTDDYLRNWVASGVPMFVVDPGHLLTESVAGLIDCDNESVGFGAADYLLGAGFELFAFAGEVHGAYWSRMRGEAFVRRLESAGKRCSVYAELSAGEQVDFGLEQGRLTQWLRCLPEGTAVFAPNDIRARMILTACLKAGISVPGEISVLGVDNDALVCETAYPPLSSIEMSCEETGFRAAELLDVAMREEVKRTVLPALRYGFARVVRRGSCVREVFGDELVRKVREFIRLNLRRGFSVPQAAKAVGVSRRTLETRFRKGTGNSIRAELIRCRLARAEALLTEGALAVSEVAEVCGFVHTGHLDKFFREVYGVTPLAFRKGRRKEGL